MRSWVFLTGELIGGKWSIAGRAAISLMLKKITRDYQRYSVKVTASLAISCRRAHHSRPSPYAFVKMANSYLFRK